MIGEVIRKELILEHCRRLNSADLDHLLELYAEDVSFEDPVGSGRKIGRDALRSHFAEAIAGHAHLAPERPAAAQDGTRAVATVMATMDYLPLGPRFAERGWLPVPAHPESTRLLCNHLLVIYVGADNLICDFEAFWGESDLGIVE